MANMAGKFTIMMHDTLEDLDGAMEIHQDGRSLWIPLFLIECLCISIATCTGLKCT